MTYNAIFKGGYSRDHLSGASQTETYRDVWYNGEHQDLITYDRDESSYSRSNDLYGGFNARYRTDKAIITHSVGWQWKQNPGSGSHGEIKYMPEIIASDKMQSEMRGLSISPNISGVYRFVPNNKLAFGGSWGLSHSHNNNYSSYSDLGLDPIVTASKENIYGITASLFVQQMLRENMQLSLIVDENRSVSDADYSGSTVSTQWQSYGKTNLKLPFWYRPVKSVSFLLTPEISLYDWDVNHLNKKSEWMPGVNLRLHWAINGKNSLSLSAWYNQQSPASSMRNDLILRQTELKWLEGNPDIQSSDSYWLSMDYYMAAIKWLSVNFGVNYIISNSESAIIYRSGGKEYSGVIGEYINAGRFTNFMPQLDLGLSLFSGKLRVNTSLTYYLTSYRNLSTLAYWRVRPNVDWYFGNCSLGIYYWGGQKYFSHGGMGYQKSPAGYGLSFDYGNGNFNFGLSVDDIFNKRMTSTSYYLGDCYNSVSKSWSNGRSVSVNITYTFDYGKKVEPGINISEQNIQSTSVLGSGK